MIFPLADMGVVGAAFLLGSIPFGYFAGKLRGIDIREHGSGNIGATNAGRVLGKPWGVGVFILDFGKAFLAVGLASYLVKQGVAAWRGDVLQVAAGLAAVLGHNFCPWLGWKGGKGIASTAGVLVGVFPGAFAWAAAAWFLVALVSRYVSLASIAAALALGVSGVWLYGGGAESVKAPAAVLLGLLAILRHRSNIGRLMKGEEPKMFGAKKKKDAGEGAE
jgi:glycerol-3-phosphate acyltransferase PlsY